MHQSTSLVARKPLALPLAFAFIYFAWGATYLGSKWAVADMPALLMSGTRFVLAGLLLLGGIAVFDRPGFRRGTMREWLYAGQIGVLLLTLGVGTGNWAQRYVDSSFVAMVFSALPLWVVVIDWLRPGGCAPNRAVMTALVIGCLGILMILAPPAGATARMSRHLGVDVLLVLASLSWAAGSVLSRYGQPRGSALLTVARQMIVGGLVLLFASWLDGDPAQFHPSQVRTRGWIGFAYLLTIGSLGGYPVYIWLLRVCTPTKAATIPYMNLLVAVLLGCSLGHEKITPRLLAGTAIVLLSVTITLRAKTPVALPPGD